MYRLLLIGCSAGGVELLGELLSLLPQPYPLPIVLVQHLPGGYHCQLASLLAARSHHQVYEAQDKQLLRSGYVYLAPPDYHLFFELAGQHQPAIALSVDEAVNGVRPSIDISLQSAAERYETDLVAVLLSGANSDGVAGLRCVKRLGGLTLVLDPACTEFNVLPYLAQQRVDVDYVVSLQEIASLLRAIDEA